MQVRDLNIQQLLALPENEFAELHEVCRFQKASNQIRKKEAKPLFKQEFRLVAELKETFSSFDVGGFVKAFKELFGMSEREFFTLNIKDFYTAFNWIGDQLKMVYEVEKELQGDVDTKLIQAGVEKLNIFKELNILIAIGEKFSKPPHEVEKWSYEMVFSLTLHDKISNEIQTNYSKLINQKR